MNINLILILIATFGLLLFWLFYRQANSTQKLAQKYLLEKLKDKNLDAEQRQKLEQDLSRILIADNSNGNSLAIIAVVAVFTIPFSLYFYHQLGNPKAIDYVAPKTQQQAVAAQQAPQMSMQEAIKQLEQRLAQNPNDVDGQMLYARSQISLKNYKKAVTAYRKANELAPNESVILTELAEAIALASNNRSFLGEPEGLLAKAVELKPNNQKALWLLGMTYYEHQDWQKTNAIWSKLYGMIGDAAAKKQLAQQLNDIRAKLGLPAISDTEQQDKTENSLVTDK
ncbi:MAG TPA: tetratricopeptide repeat protein, partial [Oceanospirillales bacterium]|nr:tetratricopeptide repeat protein [Oceanospirillales bacterium]